MGAYEIVVTILFLLVAAVGLWNAVKNFRLGAAETEKEARKVPLERGGALAECGRDVPAGGTVCALAGVLDDRHRTADRRRHDVLLLGSQFLVSRKKALKTV